MRRVIDAAYWGLRRRNVAAEVHGVYVEPQPGTGPCVENRGGH
ncbi:hypothetical protein [Streptomyces griseus]